MTFRDDRVALRERISALEGELAETRTQLERAQQDLTKERDRKTRPSRLSEPWWARWGRPSKLRVAALVLVLLSLTSLAVLLSVGESWPRPERNPPAVPALEPMPSCELWSGTAPGNDQAGQLELRLCPDGGEVKGIAQWSSPQSGWNRRSIQGRWTENSSVLVLRDLRFEEQHAAPGWSFCLVDRYELRHSSRDRLTGTFQSRLCEDRGTLELRLVAPSSAAPASPAASSASAPRSISP